MRSRISNTTGCGARMPNEPYVPSQGITEGLAVIHYYTQANDSLSDVPPVSDPHERTDTFNCTNVSNSSFNTCTSIGNLMADMFIGSSFNYEACILKSSQRTIYNLQHYHRASLERNRCEWVRDWGPKMGDEQGFVQRQLRPSSSSRGTEPI